MIDKNNKDNLYTCYKEVGYFKIHSDWYNTYCDFIKIK